MGVGGSSVNSMFGLLEVTEGEYMSREERKVGRSWMVRVMGSPLSKELGWLLKLYIGSVGGRWGGGGLSLGLLVVDFKRGLYCMFILHVAAFWGIFMHAYCVACCLYIYTWKWYMDLLCDSSQQTFLHTF